MKATRYEIKEAIRARIDNGSNFLSGELVEIARNMGMPKPGAFVQAMMTALKKAGTVKKVDNAGRAYIWRHADAVGPTPFATAPLPYPADIRPHGPFDPDPVVEGNDGGFTELLAQFLWQTMGRRNADLVRDRALDGIDVMEANGWRHLSDLVLNFLAKRGLNGPGGPQRQATGWSYAWVYEIADWAIYDAEGRFVATMGEEQDLPLVLAAPRMAAAIQGVLARAETQGGIKRSDLALLAEAIEGLPPVVPPPADDPQP